MIDDFEGRSRTSADCVANIVAAYISSHCVALGDLPTLIAVVQASLTELDSNRQINISETVTATQAAIRKSIKPDALVSFINGKSYKSLKRHLRAYGMTASTYRLRYGLPPDYPMITTSYSVRRSSISKGIISNLRKSGRPVGRDNISR